MTDDVMFCVPPSWERRAPLPPLAEESNDTALRRPTILFSSVKVLTDSIGFSVHGAAKGHVLLHTRVT